MKNGRGKVPRGLHLRVEEAQIDVPVAGDQEERGEIDAGKSEEHEEPRESSFSAASYFFPKNWPILASHFPHLWRVTPRNLELPRGKPVLCRLSTWTNSSLLRFPICHRSSGGFHSRLIPQ